MWRPPLMHAQPIRVMAAVVAKNAVGSSWRKTLGSREWSRVPAEEQAAVRDKASSLLFHGKPPPATALRERMPSTCWG